MSKTPVKLLQVNLQHGKAATAELSRCISMKQTCIALIQEPYVYKNRIRGLPVSQGNILVGTLDSKPRACIWVDKSINLTLLPQFSNGDLVAAVATLSTNEQYFKFLLVSAYLPYDSTSPPPSSELEGVVEYSRAEKIAIIIACDSNAHNIVWGSTNTNLRGSSLLEFIHSANLDILNKGHEPTFVNRARREIIDITLCSSTIFDKIKNWHVSSLINASDHRAICFEITLDIKLFVPYRDPKKTNWESYVAGLRDRVLPWEGNIVNIKDLENKATKLVNAISESFQSACPLITKKANNKVPWWNSALLKHRTRVRKQFNKAKASNNPAEWERFSDLQKDYKKAVRKAKREGWKRICGEVEGVPSAARLHKVLARDPLNLPGIFQLDSGQYTNNDAEAAMHLLTTHFPGCQILQEASPDPTGSTNHGLDSSDWEAAGQVVTLEKAIWATNSFAPFKSPGMDGIYPVALQKGIELLVGPLCDLYRACIAYGYIPTCWRKVRVIFIPKPGKKSYYLAKSYRPISLTSFLLKILERLVETHFRYELVDKLTLHYNQFAYQKGKSTEAALHKVVHKIEKALHFKEFALGAFIDIEGAFDNTSFEAIEASLISKGVNNTLVRWVCKMLNSRQIYTELGNSEVTVSVIKGCPQGGVLSPLLWCLVVDDLLSLLNKNGLFTVGYADDLAIIINGKHLSVLGDLLNRAISMTLSWCRNKGLTVSLNKTTTVLFTNKRKIEGLNMPSIGGQQLLLSKEVKFLGITLDSRLTWKSHLDNRIDKAFIAFMQCKRAFSRSWGLSPRIVNWLYTAVIRPMFCYGAVVWWTRTKLTSVKNQLTKLQRIACVGITGAMRTSPTAALEALLDLLPLDLFVKKEAELGAFRLQTTNQMVAGTNPFGHMTGWTKLKKEFTETEMPCDYLVPRPNFNRRFSIEFPSRNDWIGENKSLPPSGDCWYTDGSLRDGLAGAGFCSVNQAGVVTKKAVIPLGKHATVFQAEIVAISACVNQLLESDISEQDIVICSDSKAALMAVKSQLTKSKLVQDCVNCLNELSCTNRVNLLWVPGHCDVSGNETADSLARNGSERAAIGPEPFVPISVANVKGLIENNARIHHTTRWNQGAECRQAKLLGCQPSKARARQIIGLSRDKIQSVVSVLTGHCRLNYHLNLLNIADDPSCVSCDTAEETAEHFLCQCPAYQQRRLSTLGKRCLAPNDIARIPISRISSFIEGSGRLTRSV